VGWVASEKLRGKLMLIGATAAGIGERVASPFVRYTDAHADQHGALMPGVEILANEINVILRARYYTETSDFAAFLWAAITAALTLLLLEAAQGGSEVLKQTTMLIDLTALILVDSYLTFSKLLMIPP